MKNNWRKSPIKYKGNKTIELSHPMEKNLHEVAMYGKYGSIWLWGYNATTQENIYAAVINSHKVANKLAPQYNKEPSCKRGDELIIKFPESRLNSIKTHLKVPKNQAAQLSLATKRKTILE